MREPPHPDPLPGGEGERRPPLRLLQDLLLLLRQRIQRRLRLLGAVESAAEILYRGLEQLVVARHVPEVAQVIQRLRERRVVRRGLAELIALEDLDVGGEAGLLLNP